MKHLAKDHLVTAAICAVIILMISAPAAAGIVYVKWDSPGAGSPAVYDGKSWGTAYHTVQSGINAASVGDEVWVAAGTYPESISMNDGVALYGGFAGTETARSQRDFRSRLSRLAGTSGHTIVTCWPWPDTMLFHARLDGFRIESDTGATNTAVSVSSYGRAIIANNTIVTSSPSSSYQGAIFCGSSDTIIAGNTITAKGYYAVDCYGCSPTIVSNQINSTSGGGIYCELSSPVIVNNTISSTVGPGVRCVSSSPTIVNNILARNQYGVYVDKIPYPNLPSSPSMSRNCVYLNGLNYYQVQPGASDMQQDPLFTWADTHIKTTSPCVDAGDDSVLAFYCTDIDGQPRIQGAHADIGADETMGTVRMIPTGVMVVTPDGDDTADGASWQTAKRTIQAAINVAPAGSEIWVSSGVYPERITLREGVALYGGFSGFETARGQRNWSKCASTLDGNKLGPVVMSPPDLTSAARIDGFTIRNGLGTKGNQANYTCGGGVYCDRSSPSIANNTIAANSAGLGAGIYCLNSSATIQGNTISRNSGNGIYCDSSSPRILGNKIGGNSASSEGGGISSTGASTPIIANNLISANNALRGGAISCGTATITNNTIVSNSASLGGAVNCSYLTTLTNNIITFNSSGILAPSGGGQGPTLRRNCLYSNGTFNYMGWTINEREDRQNIYRDPRIASVDLGNPHLQPDSPCTDVGYDGATDPSWTDIDGQARITGPFVDIGADESDGASWTAVPIIVRVKTDGDDINDGSTWALAKKTVQAGIESVFAKGPGEVWVKVGTYNERISLRAYVHVYGGFAGGESSRSQADPKANVTVLDGQQLGCVVTSKEAGYRVSTIDGFTITNGKGNGQTMDAGGVYCYRSSPLISRNIISNNTGYSSGGGIDSAYASPDIVRNSITGNTPSGIDCYQGSASVTMNYIAGNRGPGLTAFDCYNITYPVIIGNVFAGNTDGGIRSSNATPTVISNTFVGNTTTRQISNAVSCTTSYGNIPITVANNIVAFNNAGIAVSSGAVLRNNCVFGNTWYNTVGTEPQNGGIADDPLFVNKNGGDYHLLPGSPCIDTGTNNGAPLVDKDGMPRPLDGDGDGAAVQDVGAYEFAGMAYAMRNQPDGTLIGITGAAATAVSMPGPAIYVENVSRSTGIRVATDGMFTEGQVLNVYGTVQTDTATGERYVAPIAGWPKPTGATTIVKPIFLSHRDLGGGSAGLQNAVGGAIFNAQHNGLWTPAAGLNNLGLLVTVFGGITHTGDGFFYLDDGSAVGDGSGNTGLKVSAPSLTFPSQGLVKVTGISSCEKNLDGKIIRVLRVRKQADIQALE